MSAIIEHLKLSGEQLDADIAEALQLPLEQVRADMQELSATGAVMTCFVTRYRDGRRLKGGHAAWRDLFRTRHPDESQI